MKWRNSEGREFPAWDREPFSTGSNVGGERLSPRAMRELGYELVEKEPDGAISPEDVICELRIGIAKGGPYLSLTNHDAGEVQLTIWPHQAEAIWMPMCEQLGIPYVAPDWDALGVSK